MSRSLVVMWKITYCVILFRNVCICFNRISWEGQSYSNIFFNRNENKHIIKYVFKVIFKGVTDYSSKTGSFGCGHTLARKKYKIGGQSFEYRIIINFCDEWSKLFYNMKTNCINLLLELEIQVLPKLIVYKVVIQCADIKFISTAYNTCKMVRKCYVVSTKVT